jgi:hypothetical protein
LTADAPLFNPKFTLFGINFSAYAYDADDVVGLVVVGDEIC